MTRYKIAIQDCYFLNTRFFVEYDYECDIKINPAKIIYFLLKMANTICIYCILMLQCDISIYILNWGQYKALVDTIHDKVQKLY